MFENPEKLISVSEPDDVDDAVQSDRGLTAVEVEERRRRGDINEVHTTTSRTVEDILRDNIFTRFNLLVGSLVVLILVIGPIQDAVFGLVMVVNSAIGIVQELRAKRALDRLSLVSATRVTVVRDGTQTAVLPEEVVLDDLMVLRRGDVMVVDGVVVDGRLEVDESLLTGESDPSPRAVGETCLSGAVVLAGSGRVRATLVGEQAYAARLAAQARKSDAVHSELRSGTDRILRWVGWALAPTALILVWSQLSASESFGGAIRGAVAGTIGMVPQGLVLLISVALAVGVARLARLQVLTQQLAALEGLARVDVLCLDKTGTITTGGLTVKEVIELHGNGVSAPLGALAHSEPDPNATLRAIADAYPDPGWEVVASVPFRSDRRWSGAEFQTEGSWILGAGDELVPTGPTSNLIRKHTEAGNRVLVLARSSSPLRSELPTDLEARAVVVLGDTVRDDAAETVAFFVDQGVQLKMISGDHPSTVAAVSQQAGITGRSLAGRDLPDDADQLGSVVEATTVFGRVSPDEKRSIVRALQRNGHVVAMVGDGVNDILALKSADVGVAMGSGSGAARAVSPLILVDGRFSNMPHVVAEGRRVIGNIERVAGLYLTKTVYALMLAWAVGIAGWAFPLLPRHYTVIGVVTIGFPSFWLALEPTSTRVRSGFVARVLRFGVPLGALSALAGFMAFWVAAAESVSLEHARSVTTLTLVGCGVAVLILVARPLSPVRKLVITCMVLGSVLVFTVPGLRDFYALDLPRPAIVLSAVGIVSLTGAIMYGALRLSGWWREIPIAIRQLEGLASVVSEEWPPTSGDLDRPGGEDETTMDA